MGKRTRRSGQEKKRGRKKGGRRRTMERRKDIFWFIHKNSVATSTHR